MNRTITVKAEAIRDIEDAFDWYENRTAGLGHRFLEDLEATYAAVLAMPQRFRVYSGNYRRARRRRFPYSVLFRFDDVNVVVIAVIHDKRGPSAWQSRVEADEGNE